MTGPLLLTEARDEVIARDSDLQLEDDEVIARDEDLQHEDITTLMIAVSSTQDRGTPLKPLQSRARQRVNAGLRYGRWGTASHPQRCVRLCNKGAPGMRQSGTDDVMGRRCWMVVMFTLVPNLLASNARAQLTRGFLRPAAPNRPKTEGRDGRRAGPILAQRPPVTHASHFPAL